MSVRLLPLLVIVALVGCGAPQRQSAVSEPFTGTWHQAAAPATTGPAGFLAIDGSRLVFNLDGLPRGTVAIKSNDTDAGIRSGRLECADGHVLYLAVGDSLITRDSAEGRLLTPTQHLDVHVFAPGAGAGDQPLKILRLWPSAVLAVAALPAAYRAPIPDTAAVSAVSGSPADQRLKALFAQLDDPLLLMAADRLAAARAEGKPVTSCDVVYRRSTQTVRSDVLRDLDAARRGDRAALVRADDRIDALAQADRAYNDWRSHP